jgi:hypothetical protein
MTASTKKRRSVRVLTFPWRQSPDGRPPWPCFSFEAVRSLLLARSKNLISASATASGPEIYTFNYPPPGDISATVIQEPPTRRLRAATRVRVAGRRAPRRAVRRTGSSKVASAPGEGDSDPPLSRPAAPGASSMTARETARTSVGGVEDGASAAVEAARNRLERLLANLIAARILRDGEVGR